MQTLFAGAQSTIDLNVWNISTQIGMNLNEDSMEMELSSLACGDVVVWIGAYGASSASVAFGGTAVKSMASIDIHPNSSLPPKRRRHGGVAQLAAMRASSLLTSRGIKTVYYNTEPLMANGHIPGLAWDTALCHVSTSVFSEIWDYSHANMKRWTST